MKKMFYKILIIVLGVFLFSTSVQSGELTVENILNDINQQKDLLKTYEAELITEVQAPFVEEKQIQKAYIYYAAPDKTRTDTFAPIRQVTLRLGEEVTVLDELGNVQKLDGKAQQGADEDLTDPVKMLEKLELTIAEDPAFIYLTGIPKETNNGSLISRKNISKVVFKINKTSKMVEKAEIFDQADVLFMEIIISYEKFADIYFPITSISRVLLPQKMGQVLIATRYENVEINQDISPEIFDVEAIKRSFEDQGDDK